MTPTGRHHLLGPEGDDVGRASVSSGVIAIVSNILQMVIGIGTTLVLVRLLDPADYGVFWMGGILLIVSVSVRDLGMGVAVVNAENLTHERASGMFWFVVVTSLATAGLLTLSGPVLAWFYDTPELVMLMPVLAFTTMLSGIASVHDALLKRRLRFFAVAVRDVVGMLAGSAAALWIAFAEFGFWALAAQNLALASAGFIVCAFACRWLPSGPSTLAGFWRDRGERAHLWHGSRVATSRFISQVGLSADRVLIGAVAGDRALGLYNQSYAWAEFPTRQVYQPLLSVVVSAFSRRQDAQRERYRRAFRQVLLVLYGVTIPMLGYGAIRGGLVIPVLLGDKWTEAAPIFSWLCLAFLFRLISQACKWLYLAESRSKDNLVWTALQTPVLIAAAAIGAAFDAESVAMAIAIAYAAMIPVAIVYATKRSHVRPIDFCVPAVRPLIGTAAGAAAFLLAGPIFPDGTPDFVRLLAESATIAAACGVAWALPGRSRTEILHCVGRLIPRLARPSSRSMPNAEASL